MSLAGIGKYQALSLSKTEPNHLLSAVRLFSIISILKRLLYLKFCCLPYRNRSYQRFPSAANSISRSSSNISNNISSVASLIFSALTSSRGLNSERSRILFMIAMLLSNWQNRQYESKLPLSSTSHLPYDK